VKHAPEYFLAGHTQFWTIYNNRKECFLHLPCTGDDSPVVAIREDGKRGEQGQTYGIYDCGKSIGSEWINSVRLWVVL
jgi:hypothetical protein